MKIIFIAKIVAFSVCGLALGWEISAMAQPQCNSMSSYEVFVATNGNDNNSASKSQPLKTLEKAQQKVRSLQGCMKKNITVYLRGGVYQLSKPLVFNSQDSGNNAFRVIYTAYRNENPVISGGQRITNWIGVGNGIYKTSVGSLRFRQLYINNKRVIRARTPNQSNYFRLKTWDKKAKTVVINSADVSSISNLKGTEIVIQRVWNQSRMSVISNKRVSKDTIIALREPERTRAFEQRFPSKDDNQPYHLENSLQFLDAPGEWYLNSATGELFYKPRVGENINRSVVIAPRLETLVQIEGSKENPVQNLDFRGISFKHTTWNAPDTEGYTGVQGGITYGTKSATSGVLMKYAQNLRLERNTFQHMGGMGVTLSNGTRNIHLVGNVVTDISDNGISLGIPVTDTSDPREKVSDNLIQNNYISRIGQDYYGSVGIFAGYTSGLKIEYNELTDMPYTGISVGWGWTNKDTSLKNNLIRYNRIHNVMKLLYDGGGIYTLSKQPGTILAHNYIYDLIPSKWVSKPKWISGIYLDQGSSFMRLENNVIVNVPSKVTMQQAVQPTAKNNTVIYNQTILYSVKNNSGLQPLYQNIKNRF